MTSRSPGKQLREAARGAGVAAWRGVRPFFATGADAVDLLSRLSSQDLGPLASGRAVTTVFLSPTGRTLHRVLLQPEAGGLRVLAESAGGASLADWVDRYTFAEDCRLEELSGHAALLLVGRRAAELAASIGHGGLEGEGDRSARGELLFARRAFGPLPSVIVTGPAQDVEDCLEELHEAGAVPLDEQGLLQLRVEAGVPAAGAEIAEDYHLLEAGLRDDVSFTKGCYTGQEVVARQDTYDKVARTLVGLVFEGRPQPGEELASEEKAGCVVTSVAPEASEGLPAGPACLGYVRTRNADEGAAVCSASGLAGRVVRLPFPRLRGG